MKPLQKKALSGALLLSMFFSTFAVSSAAVAANETTKSPEQIALALTSNPQTSIRVNWTTIDTALTNPAVLVWEKNAKEETAEVFAATVETRDVNLSTILDSSNQPITKKNFYSAEITGLKPNKEYSYRCGTRDAWSDVRSFKTAPDHNGEFTFIYVSDSQVSGNHSKAWQANLDIAKKMYPDAKFIYIAGDLTNTADNEGQWESFFNQPGNAQYNEKFSGSLISELPLAAVMGNHDSKNGGIGGMGSHYTWGSEVDGVPVSYAFDYGVARMIFLNIEDAYSMNNEEALIAQTEFLKNEVAEAKAENKWTIVGFHKSIYSGANHMDDSNVIFNRKYWSPVFAELDVDVVLQGHDHVLSRGFIKADGTKADVTKQTSDRTFMAKKPDNAPLYYVGNTGSSLKFYAPIMSNDYIQPGDPVAPDFGYLDINSALPAGYLSTTGQLLNPGPSTNDDLEEVDPDFYRTPTFTAVTVSKGSMEFKTFMTGFDPETNSIVRNTFMYDNLKVINPKNSEEKPSFEFGVIADVQYDDAYSNGATRFYSNSVSKLTYAAETLNQHDLAFTVQLGDLIDKDLDSFSTILPIFNKIESRKYHVLGNHDFPVKTDEVADILGMSNQYYDFGYAGWRFVVLDTNDISLYANAEGSDKYRQAQTMYNELKDSGAINAQTWNGAVGSEQLAWLHDVLNKAAKKNEKVIVFAHMPVSPENEHNVWNGDELIHELESSGNVVAYFNGHNHAGNFSQQNGIYYINFQGMVDTPDTNAYSIIRVFKDRLEIDGYGREPYQVLIIEKK